jgi:two-component system osmolarity sensor histidine kinase EnvZ
VSAASWVVARRLTRPLVALRRRIESHQGPATRGGKKAEADPPNPAAAEADADPASTLEIGAIESARLALTARLDHQESERALLLAGVSHDLRSPLARIRMAAELLDPLIGNLVDNALRRGRPPVRVRPGIDGPHAVIAVQDHGAGIAIAEQARMTQAFARGDESRGTPGTGLGLAVVQQIVRRMGGVLSFDPVDGVPCVRVQLPMQ